MNEEVVAGRRPVLELIRSGRAVNKILYAEGAQGIGQLLAEARAAGIVCQQVDKRKLDQSAPGVRHQGVAALAAEREYAELEDLFAAAEAAGKIECCGLLIGNVRNGMGQDGVAQVREILPALNVAEAPERAFEIDPRTLLAAHRSARKRGEAILGWYHSHPSGVALPSTCDAERAAENGKVWVIVAGADMAAYVAVQQGDVAGRFRPLPLRVISPEKCKEAMNGNG